MICQQLGTCALERAEVPLCSEVERRVGLKRTGRWLICTRHWSCELAWTCQPFGSRICKVRFWQCHFLCSCWDYVSRAHFCRKFRIQVRRIKFTGQFRNSEIAIILHKSDSTFCVHVYVYFLNIKCYLVTRF